MSCMQLTPLGRGWGPKPHPFLSYAQHNVSESRARRSSRGQGGRRPAPGRVSATSSGDGDGSRSGGGAGGGSEPSPEQEQRALRDKARLLNDLFYASEAAKFDGEAGKSVHVPPLM